MSQNEIKSYFQLSESKAVDVLFWLLENRDKDNVIHTTLDTVATECKVTKVTVNRVFQRLYKAGFLERVRNGQYQMKRV